MIFLIITSCKSTEINNAVDELLQSTHKINNPNLYRKFLFYGKEAIPVLIENIDVDRKNNAGYFNPLNSNLFSLANYDGVYAAYMIEFILSRERLDEKNLHSEISYVLFNRNIIIRPKDRRLLKLEDMRAIQKIYATWWQLNKNQSIEELRIEWKKRNRPLSNSIYWWY